MSYGKVMQSVVIAAVLAAGLIWSGNASNGPVDCGHMACPPIVMSDTALDDLPRGQAARI